jgi:hypothetical protein
MSYFTMVRIETFGDDSVTIEMLLKVAETFLDAEGCYATEDILGDLKKGLETGSTDFSDLRSATLGEMFQVLSRSFPKLTLRIWGHGEELWDIWSREYKGGKQTFKRGPFER